MLDVPVMITTRAARDVVTIADIEAPQTRPYNELIPARTLIDLGFPGRPSTISVRRGPMRSLANPPR
jgi:hypothetical protein